MPRKGHHHGRGTPKALLHYEVRYGIQLRADRLTVQKRNLARSDPAVAAHFRKRIREPTRFDAFIGGRGWFHSDTSCPHCQSTRRRTYDAYCLDCAIRKRPLQLTGTGRVAAWPKAERSRDGWHAVKDAERAERIGKSDAATFCPFEARRYPTGRLTVDAPSLGLSIPDLRSMSFEEVNNIVIRHPAMLELLRWAGWA